MLMRSTAPFTFPIELSDLESVLGLLNDQALIAVDDLETRDLIISDLAKLPSTDIWPFTATFINSFTSKKADHGGGSQWVSIDADEYSLRFSVGNHDHTPGIGGDTFSETIFECWPGGCTEGHLSAWLAQLNLLDHDLIKISISHERAGCENLTEPAIIEGERTYGIPPPLSDPIGR